MAEPRDPRVRAAYRALPDEAPSPELDAAIRAAARRAAGSRPGGARRWQVPISIAAVLALAIGVSLQVEREKPLRIDEGPPPSAGSAEYPVPAAEPEQRAAPAKPPSPAAPAPLLKESAPARAEPPKAVPEAKRFAADPPRPAEPARANVAPPPAAAFGTGQAGIASPAKPAAATLAPMPAASPPATQPPAAADAAAPARAASPQSLGRAKLEAAREAVTQEEKAVAGAPDSPERQLERIAALRERGSHDEADRALAEFRRLHPDYRLSPEWQRRVERP